MLFKHRKPDTTGLSHLFGIHGAGSGAARLMRKAKIIYFRVFLDFVLLFFTALASTFPFFMVLYHGHSHLLFQKMRFRPIFSRFPIIYFFDISRFVPLLKKKHSSTFAFFSILYHPILLEKHLSRVLLFFSISLDGFSLHFQGIFRLLLFPVMIFLLSFKGFLQKCIFP